MTVFLNNINFYILYIQEIEVSVNIKYFIIKKWKISVSIIGLSFQSLFNFEFL